MDDLQGIVGLLIEQIYQVRSKPLDGDSLCDCYYFLGNRDATHKACNVKLWLNPITAIFPVFLNTLQGSDAHFGMKIIS